MADDIDQMETLLAKAKLPKVIDGIDALISNQPFKMFKAREALIVWLVVNAPRLIRAADDHRRTSKKASKCLRCGADSAWLE